LFFLVYLVLLIDLRDCLDIYRGVTSSNFSTDLLKVSTKPEVDFRRGVSILEMIIDTFESVETTFKEGVETAFRDFLSFKNSEKTIDSCKQKKKSYITVIFLVRSDERIESIREKRKAYFSYRLN
jgi:hypothetical protein